MKYFLYQKGRWGKEGCLDISGPHRGLRDKQNNEPDSINFRVRDSLGTASDINVPLTEIPMIVAALNEIASQPAP